MMYAFLHTKSTSQLVKNSPEDPPLGAFQNFIVIIILDKYITELKYLATSMFIIHQGYICIYIYRASAQIFIKYVYAMYSKIFGIGISLNICENTIPNLYTHPVESSEIRGSPVTGW